MNPSCAFPSPHSLQVECAFVDDRKIGFFAVIVALILGAALLCSAWLLSGDEWVQFGEGRTGILLLNKRSGVLCATPLTEDAEHVVCVDIGRSPGTYANVRIP